MSTTPIGEKIVALEKDMENMKFYIKKLEDGQSAQWSHIGKLGMYIYIGVGITVTLNAVAVLWVAFYHH